MAEWSNAAVLKTVVLRGTGGSNPSLSAESESNLKQTPVSQPLQGFLMRNILQKEAKKRSFSVDFWWTKKVLILVHQKRLKKLCITLYCSVLDYNKMNS